MAKSQPSAILILWYLFFDPYNSDVMSKFRSALERSGTSVNELIAALNMRDTNSSGMISLKHFDEIIQKLGLLLSFADVERLTLRFNPNFTESVDIEHFIGALRADKSLNFASSDNRLPEEIAVDKTLEVLGTRIKHMLHKESASSVDVVKLFDLRDMGQFDLRALQIGARNFGVDMSREVARGCLRKMCLHVRGLVDESNLIDAILGRSEHTLRVSREPFIPVTPANEDSAMAAALRRHSHLRDQLLAAMIRAQKKYGFTLKHLMREFLNEDAQELGEIQRLSFVRALRSAHVELPDQDARELAHVVGDVAAPGGGPVMYFIFMNCIEDIFTARMEVDAAFDSLSRRIVSDLVGGSNMERVFDEIDLDNDMELGVDDFAAALREFNPSLGRPEIIAAMSRIAPIGMRKMSLTMADFDEYFTPIVLEEKAIRDAAANSRDQNRSDPKSLLRQNLNSIRERVLIQIKDLSAGAKERCRERVDRIGEGRSRNLTFDQMLQITEQTGLDMEPEDVSNLFEELSQGSRQISGNQFLNWLGMM